MPSVVLIAVLLALGARSANGEAPSPATGERVVLNGVRLWYKVAGKARAGVAPVLYLPGGPGYNSYSFEKTIGRQLEQRVRVIYFDERGTGRSERPADGDYAMRTLTADIEALREHLGLPQISVMGQSFGGTIALEYAARYPAHTQRVISVDGGSDYPEAIRFWETELKSREPASWSQAMQTPEGRALAAAEAHPNDACALTKAQFAVVWQVYGMPVSPAFHHWQQFHDQRFEREQERWDAQSNLGNSGELMRAFFSAGNPALCYRFVAFARLTMPVLVIEGRYDGAVNPSQARELARHLPHARYDEFTRSAHFPYAEEPAKFVRDVAEFLTHPVDESNAAPNVNARGRSSAFGEE